MTSRSATITNADRRLLALAFIPAAIVTWGLHESAHWLAGTALGYDMWMTFNNAGTVGGAYDSTAHQVVVTLAGPAVTWLQGIGALGLIRRSGALWAYSFLFLACWMRAVAMGISFVSHPNDEASASLLLGLPMWVLPAVSVAFLLVFAFRGSRELGAGWRENAIAYVMASAVTAVIVLSDQWLFG